MGEEMRACGRWISDRQARAAQASGQRHGYGRDEQENEMAALVWTLLV
jgi:hypothetical protein